MNATVCFASVFNLNVFHKVFELGKGEIETRILPFEFEIADCNRELRDLKLIKAKESKQTDAELEELAKALEKDEGDLCTNFFDGSDDVEAEEEEEVPSAVIDACRFGDDTLADAFVRQRREKEAEKRRRRREAREAREQAKRDKEVELAQVSVLKWGSSGMRKTFLKNFSLCLECAANPWPRGRSYNVAE